MSPRPAFRDERNREFAGRRLVREVTVWPAVFAPVGTPRALHCGRARVGERRTTRTRPRVRLTRTSERRPRRARGASSSFGVCPHARASRRVIARRRASPVPPRSAWRSSARRHPSDPTSALDAAMSDPARIPDPQRSSGTGSRPDGDAAGASASTPPRADDRPKLELTGSMKKRRRKAEAKQTMKGMKNLIGEVRSKRAEEKRREQEETFPAPPVATSGPASASVPARSPPPPPRVRGGLVTPPATPSPSPSSPRGSRTGRRRRFALAVLDGDARRGGVGASRRRRSRVRGWSRRRRRAVLRARRRRTARGGHL